jgi:predicted nucleotidyltransferase
MTRDAVVSALAAHASDLRRFGVRSLALFGSVARGDDRPGSDVDLLVEFDHTPKFDEYMDLKFLLEDLLGRPVDLVSAKALKPEARTIVEEEAIRVA